MTQTHESRLSTARGLAHRSALWARHPRALFSCLANGLLSGALSWVARWYRPDGGLDPAEISRQSIALLLNGLRPRPDLV